MRSYFGYRPRSSQKNRFRVQGSGFRTPNSALSTTHYSLSTNSSFILHPSSFILRSKGYTLVEILIAATLTLILLAAVVQMFASVGQSITNSRSLLESSDRLRSAAARLQMDLQGATATMLPPRTPEDGEGYFEYIEGSVIQTNTGSYGNPQPINAADGQIDTSVGDFDDILMFTTRSTGKPFVGAAPIFNPSNSQFGLQSVQTGVAEVAWFVRGRTLYRRILIIAPGPWEYFKDSSGNLVYPDAQSYYGNYDVSVRAVWMGGVWRAIPNTLSDLTRRECRFAHPTGAFPFDARLWGQYGLPTLRECSDPNWVAGLWNVPASAFPKNTVDFWSNQTDTSNGNNPLPDNALGSGSRIADDVILTNVIGFDIKAWDPGANSGLGAYVDLGNYDTINNPSPPAFLTDYGAIKSMLRGSINTARVYDTWSTHYENVGLLGWPTATYPPGRGTNGFDDNNDGVVDDENEKLTSPPYPVPLRGVQVKIRVFEPDSRQIREITVVQDFLPK